MSRRTLLFTTVFALFFAYGHADNVVWKGEINADGTPTSAIKLEVRKRYQIKVSGFVNLGKWKQGGKNLANDACYEFDEEGNTFQRVETIKNSHDITVCSDKKYHPDHVYQSEPFVAKQDRIHFWIYDTYYDDNSGSLKVEVSQVTEDVKK